ncbi:hypothetical protein PybrP1_006761 [[Pythium] brassicae (nom. inval.)]|nr:hypothetical protein PybrP1_006761 [[Pythium] brassicae (nom. inval.)]
MQSIASLPQDIARLNASRHQFPAITADTAARGLTTTSKVFGWRNYLLQQLGSSSGCTPDGSSASSRAATRANKSVVWKASKTYESTAMQPLAQRVWDAAQVLAQRPASSRVCSFEVLYTVSATVRVVKQVEALFGRRELETVWVERFLDRKDHICIGRKQLARFRDYQLHDDEDNARADVDQLDERECEGFLLRPYLTKLGEDDGTLMLGSTVQRVSSVACRDLESPDALIQSIVGDLPRFTLQWEEAVVHDLLPQISF